MDENNRPTVVPAEEERDQALFDAIGKDKKRKKRRAWITAVVIVALVAAGLTAAVLYGQKKVREQMGNMNYSPDQVVAYTVDTGSVNTTVTGSGLLSDVDTEKITLPKGVTVDKLLVKVGEKVEEGDILATVEPSSVLGALADVQSRIQELDGKLREAAADAVGTSVNAGVNGRVKRIYAAEGDDVAACMTENGALALISLDGWMAVEVETDALAEGDTVTVVRAGGQEIRGTVESAIRGTAVVLVTDNGPLMDETVTVRAADGTEAGSGTLYIHNPLRVTGFAGTVARVNTAENRQVWNGNSLFTLKDTAYSANYESILKDRRELEEDLIQLLAYYRSGAVEAPFTGTVSSVQWSDRAKTQDDGAQTGSGYGTGTTESYGYGNIYDLFGTAGANGTDTAGGTQTNANGETDLLTLSPDERMNVTISVDETDIMALEAGQGAQITITSIGDEVFFGEVTEVNRFASASSGVTSYTAVVSMPKDLRMLPGMSAKVVIRIQGVENTILIPEAALHQTRDSSFVYTSYNWETREFGGAVAVIPGLSNGSMVEIIEGLREGDTVWYTQVWDPWAWSYGSDGNASGGDAWISVDASDGDAWASDGDVWASDGDAE